MTPQEAEQSIGKKATVLTRQCDGWTVTIVGLKRDPLTNTVDMALVQVDADLIKVALPIKYLETKE